jgi:predicted nucleic acid-binding protein
MYLLDTDILSNLLRHTPSTVLIAKLALVPSEQQFTSSITLGELIYGACRLGPRGARYWSAWRTRSCLICLYFRLTPLRHAGMAR